MELQAYKYWLLTLPVGPWFSTDNTVAGGIPVGPDGRGLFVTEEQAQKIKELFDARLKVESVMTIDPRFRSDDDTNRWVLTYTDNAGRECVTPVGIVLAEICQPLALEPWEKFGSLYWIGIDPETQWPAVDDSGNLRGVLGWCDPQSNGLTFQFRANPRA
jgi:hypothetical protein